MNKQIPVYLFTGFLDAGKTRFIQETMEDERFNNGDRTLLLMCEEGEEEYDATRYPSKNVFLESIESKDELTAEHLDALLKKHKAERVVLEYNGMWLLDDLYTTMPDGWLVYQEFAFFDARNFISYNSNMRQLVYDKLKSCEMAVFNRFSDDLDKLEIHKIVRAVSRRTDIVYEYTDGSVSYDEIEDPLPFDVNADIIEIEDRDYALWYQDLGTDMAKYEGKTVRFKGLVAKSLSLPSDCFVIGRKLMQCCEADIQYVGLICQWPEAKKLKKTDWVQVTASIEIKYHKGYGKKGPVLSASSVELCEAPEQPVATFY